MRRCLFCFLFLHAHPLLAFAVAWKQNSIFRVETIGWFDDGSRGRGRIISIRHMNDDYLIATDKDRVDVCGGKLVDGGHWMVKERPEVGAGAVSLFNFKSRRARFLQMNRPGHDIPVTLTKDESTPGTIWFLLDASTMYFPPSIWRGTFGEVNINIETDGMYLGVNDAGAVIMSDTCNKVCSTMEYLK